MIKKISAFAAALTLTASAAGMIPYAVVANPIKASAAEETSSFKSKIDLSTVEYTDAETGETKTKRSPYFPVIGDQNPQGACCSFASTYYQFTYEARKTLKEKYGIDSDDIYSPAFVFNQTNSGYMGNGGNSDLVYNVLENQGALTYRDGFEFNKDVANKVPRDAEQLCKALNFRVVDKDEFYTDEIGEENAFKKIKEKLNEGKVVFTGGSWNYTPYDNLFCKTVKIDGKDQQVALQNSFRLKNYKGEDNVEGAHAFVIVGYDDDITYTTDDGKEFKGAFKIVNSWGNWGNEGFLWIMYDAFYKESKCGYTYDTNTYARRPAFAGGDFHTIDVDYVDVKLVTEANIMSTNFYGLDVYNTTENGTKLNTRKVDSFISEKDVYNPVTGEYDKVKFHSGVPFGGSIVTDISSEIGDDYFDGKNYNLSVVNKDKDSQFIVKSIALRDNLGNLVAERELDYDMDDFVDSVKAGNNKYKSSVTADISLDLKRGDVNYDGELNYKDADMINEYLRRDPAEVKGMDERFSTLQKDLMDVNNDGAITEDDIVDEFFFTEDGQYKGQEGVVYTGWHLINNNYYFLDENGYKVTNSFIEDENKGETLFVDEEGREVINRRFAFEGNQYCADQFGHIVKDREVVFYIYGINRTYYFDENGVQLIGWNADKTKYYDQAGMLTGTHEIDGVSYTFDENGVLVQD